MLVGRCKSPSVFVLLPRLWRFRFRVDSSLWSMYSLYNTWGGARCSGNELWLEVPPYGAVLSNELPWSFAHLFRRALN